MSYFELYLLTRLDGLRLLFWILTLAGIVLFLICIGIHEDFEEEEDLHRALKRIAIGVVFCAFAGVLIPSTKQLAIIFGLNYLTNSEEARRLPDNVLKAINDKLEDKEDKK